jgi:hypothetical protein
MNWKGFESKRSWFNEVIFRKLHRGSRKINEKLLRIFGVPVGMQIEHLQNASLDGNRFASPLDVMKPD